MEIDITCLKASEYISASVDGELDDDLSGKLEAHLIGCGRCRFELAFDRGTKTLLRSRIGSTPAPPHLRERILSDITAEAGRAVPTRSWLAGLRPPAGWMMPAAFAGAVAIALVALLFLDRKPEPLQPASADVNIVTETFNNFDRVNDGSMEPELRSGNHQEIMTYLKQRASFAVEPPTISGFRLMGAGVSSPDREPGAYIVYERDGEYVYVVQVNFREMLSSGRRYLPLAALEELQRSGWTVTGNDSDCTVAMWLQDSTLCMAVGDMGRDLLMTNIMGGSR